MRVSPLLEISVESVEAAVAAERGGADRIELCANPAIGGVTPSLEMMGKTRAGVKVPIFVMIRPRGGDFVYSDDEFAAMRRSIDDAREARMDGLVLGILTPKRNVHVARTHELIEHGDELPVTFHRAIDESVDIRGALEAIIAAGARRILTSGGKVSALAGVSVIAELVARAGERIVILPGAGIHPDNVREVARRTGATEFHSGLSSVLGRSADVERFETEVRRLKRNLCEKAAE
jgi:copper homeostasis protein